MIEVVLRELERAVDVAGVDAHVRAGRRHRLELAPPVDRVAVARDGRVGLVLLGQREVGKWRGAHLAALHDLRAQLG